MLLAFVFLAVLVTDFISTGAGLSIYLTYWTLTLEMVYFFLAGLVTLAARKALPALHGDRHAMSQPTHLPALVKAMWFTWSIVLPLSWTITCAFWILLKPFWLPETFESLTFFEVFEHLVNSLIIAGEFLVSRNAFSARNMVGGAAYAVIYVAWSLIHDIAKVGVPE